jgi:hypothetical protein
MADCPEAQGAVMPTQQWRAQTKEQAEAYRNSRPGVKSRWHKIQAAEEMYEALHGTLAMIMAGDLVFVTDTGEDADCCIAALRAALAKADGRKP